MRLVIEARVTKAKNTYCVKVCQQHTNQSFSTILIALKQKDITHIKIGLMKQKGMLSFAFNILLTPVIMSTFTRLATTIPLFEI